MVKAPNQAVEQGMSSSSRGWISFKRWRRVDGGRSWEGSGDLIKDGFGELGLHELEANSGFFCMKKDADANHTEMLPG